MKTKIISDINHQIDLKSESVQIYQHLFSRGKYNHEIYQDRFHSIFIQSGIMKIKDVEFYITQSWMNTNPPHSYHHTHMHPNLSLIHI